MDKHIDRMWTIDRIKRSINESRTIEQLASTEQFLNLYYKLFPFDSNYFRSEYMLDTDLRNRKSDLVLSDDIDPDTISFDKEKKSLKRLDEYVKMLSMTELEAEWPELLPQLDGIDVTSYPQLHEKKIQLKLIDKYYPYLNVHVKKLQKAILHW